MDINEYIEKIQKDIEERTKGILDGIQIPEFSKPRQINTRETRQHSLKPLYVHDCLEEESKSRIRTFEKLYKDTFVNETGRPMGKGIDALDYSPLVTTLCGMLEKELYCSLVPYVRISGGGKAKDINYALSHGGFGAAWVVAKNHKKIIAPFISAPDSFVNDLFSIKEFFRNPSSHGAALEMQMFLSFYEIFQPFFNNNVDGLMRMKNEVAKFNARGYGAKAASDPEEDDYLGTLFAQNSDYLTSRRRGIIFTDCDKIAEKYFGGVNEVVSISKFGVIHSADYVRGMLTSLIQEYSSIGIDYVLSDVSMPDLKVYIEQENGWRGYFSALMYFCKVHPGLLDEDDPPALFIIGGDDIIPMPRLNNPAHGLSDREKRIKEADKDVDADFLYAYGDSFLEEDPVDIRLDTFVQINPFFNVGRLPLEEGYLSTEFEDDICNYLSRAILAHKSGGIQLGNEPVMTVCESWRVVSHVSYKGLPLKKLEMLPGYTDDNLIVSPSYRLDNKGEKDSVQYCVNQLMETDMLLFDLHGGYRPKRPAYTGQGADEQSRYEYPEAFNPSFFEHANAKVVAGVCCFGARFIGYQRSDSSLLESIYRNVLLFMGSSRIAYGAVDPIPKEKRTPEYCKSTASAILLRYYSSYLLSGVEAGKALSLAKQRYVSEHAQTEWRNTMLITLLEFNQFGDPLLRVVPCFRCDTTPAFQKLSSKDATPFAEQMNVQTVYESGDTDIKKGGSLLDRVRGLVDKNLSDIHKTIADKLYREFGLEPRNLQNVQKYSLGRGNCGYVFSYCDDSLPHDDFICETIVRTTSSGNLIDMVQSH